LQIYSVLMTYVFPDKIEFLFAFYHRLSENLLEEEPLLPCVLDWDVYNDQAEWERQGVFDNGKWRVSDCNDNFCTIETYSERLVVPTSISDEVKITSQPKVGMSKATSPADESLVAGIASSSLLQDQLHIIDCRPMTNALANRAKGYGVESSVNYKNCTVSFMDIPNIHSMRDRFNEGLLLLLADALHSCRFGTFLFDCKKHRLEANLENRTASVWTWVNGFRPQLTEHTYEPKQVLNPPLMGLLKRVMLWDAMFMRWSGQPLVQEPPAVTNFFADNSQRTPTWRMPQGTVIALNTALTLKYREAQLIQELEERIAALEER
ncbi:hypothetical protein BBJ29_001112, partial [Phytophthora kernoviae]